MLASDDVATSAVIQQQETSISKETAPSVADKVGESDIKDKLPEPETAHSAIQVVIQPETPILAPSDSPMIAKDEQIAVQPPAAPHLFPNSPQHPHLFPNSPQPPHLSRTAAAPAPLPEKPAAPAPLPEQPAAPATLPEQPAAPAPIPEQPAAPAPIPNSLQPPHLFPNSLQPPTYSEQPAAPAPLPEQPAAASTCELPVATSVIVPSEVPDLAQNEVPVLSDANVITTQVAPIIPQTEIPEAKQEVSATVNECDTMVQAPKIDSTEKVVEEKDSSKQIDDDLPSPPPSPASGYEAQLNTDSITTKTESGENLPSPPPSPLSAQDTSVSESVAANTITEDQLPSPPQSPEISNRDDKPKEVTVGSFDDLAPLPPPPTVATEGQNGNIMCPPSPHEMSNGVSEKQPAQQEKSSDMAEVSATESTLSDMSITKDITEKIAGMMLDDVPPVDIPVPTESTVAIAEN
ncbi:uncharacterized protein KIAA0754-like [Ctenocephalides felis]|uniref:uncharacterized protein KIAA0754-like n=1 Tax=Ctenocephalides felis TaxID=7515 RepID=UPI000E6E22FB|nr:uncharacterized protein KIAA0754-like [Ctenocephalides felis]